VGLRIAEICRTDIRSDPVAFEDVGSDVLRGNSLRAGYSRMGKGTVFDGRNSRSRGRPRGVVIKQQNTDWVANRISIAFAT
jgi:hypothetical protein